MVRQEFFSENMVNSEKNVISAYGVQEFSLDRRFWLAGSLEGLFLREVAKDPGRSDGWKTIRYLTCGQR